MPDIPCGSLLAHRASDFPFDAAEERAAGVRARWFGNNNHAAPLGSKERLEEGRFVAAVIRVALPAKVCKLPANANHSLFSLKNNRDKKSRQDWSLRHRYCQGASFGQW
jgi:hypothetical protein